MGRAAAAAKCYLQSIVRPQPQPQPLKVGEGRRGSTGSIKDGRMGEGWMGQTKRERAMVCFALRESGIGTQRVPLLNRGIFSEWHLNKPRAALCS